MKITAIVNNLTNLTASQASTDTSLLHKKESIKDSLLEGGVNDEEEFLREGPNGETVFSFNHNWVYHREADGVQCRWNDPRIV